MFSKAKNKLDIYLAHIVKADGPYLLYRPENEDDV